MDSILSEELLRNAGFVLERIIEAAGAIVIFAGALFAFVRFIRHALITHGAAAFVAIRLDLGRYLALGLEFQLASDLLRTAIAPTFEEIGKLAAVAAIRTGLNYFLSREITRERAELAARDRQPSGGARPSAAPSASSPGSATA